MKIMNVSFSIDVCNAAHVKALGDFMNAIGDHGQPVTSSAPVVPEPSTTAPSSKVMVTDPDEVPATVTPAKKKPLQNVEAVKDEPQTEEPAAAPVKEEKQQITLDMLRVKASTMLKESPDNHTKVKAKLTELGAQSVSTLDASLYDEFYAFLSSL